MLVYLEPADDVRAAVSKRTVKPCDLGALTRELSRLRRMWQSVGNVNSKNKRLSKAGAKYRYGKKLQLCKVSWSAGGDCPLQSLTLRGQQV